MIDRMPANIGFLLADARGLVGGWLHLHPMKRIPSAFGGRVVGFEQIRVEHLAYPNRIVFLVESHQEAFEQRWAWRESSAGIEKRYRRRIATARTSGVACRRDHKTRNGLPTPTRFRVAKILTGEVEEYMGDSGKDKAAQPLGRRGGRARADQMTPQRRREIARESCRDRVAMGIGRKIVGLG